MRQLPKVAVIGATGMLGHRLVLDARQRGHVVVAVCRSPERAAAARDLFEGVRVERFGDPTTPDHACDLVRRCETDFVINAAGLIKQRPGGDDDARLRPINAVFPHRLARACDARGVRLIHLSTDCVFSGRSGLRDEDDRPDPVDAYGRSKLDGEPTGRGVITLRTSMIGRELVGTAGLVEWLISNRNGQVNGFLNAVFSGLVTKRLASIILDLTCLPTAVAGLYHVAAPPIAKHELLCRVQTALALDIDVLPVADPILDRSLDARRFFAKTGIEPPRWDDMIDELVSDAERYEDWRVG